MKKDVLEEIEAWPINSDWDHTRSLLRSGNTSELTKTESKALFQK